MGAQKRLDPNEYLTTEQAADEIGKRNNRTYDSSTVRRWCRKKLLKHIESTRDYLIRRADLNVFEPPTSGRPAKNN